MLHDYETIIWDWNGTLLNDRWLCVELVNQLLVNHNDLQLDESGYQEVFGFPIVDYYQRIGIDFNKESFEVLTHKFISSYDARVKSCALHEKVIEVLGDIQNKGMRQFILTAAHKESVLQLLEHYAIGSYFMQVEGLDNHRAESKVLRGKHLMENQGIEPEKTVLIGDTAHDFEVAEEIGVECILIANGHQSRARLLENTGRQIAVLDRIEELFG